MYKYTLIMFALTCGSCNVIASQHSFVSIAIEGQGDLPNYGRLNTIIYLVDGEHTIEYFSGNIEIDSHGHVVLRVPSIVDSVAIEVEALPRHGGTASAEIPLASVGESEKGLFIVHGYIDQDAMKFLLPYEIGSDVNFAARLDKITTRTEPEHLVPF